MWRHSRIDSHQALLVCVKARLEEGTARYAEGKARCAEGIYARLGSLTLDFQQDDSALSVVALHIINGRNILRRNSTLIGLSHYLTSLLHGLSTRIQGGEECYI
jgi:hypothetical protein